MISNVISIENMIDSYGEEATEALLSSFSCARDGIQKNMDLFHLERESESDGHSYIQLLKGF